MRLRLRKPIRQRRHLTITVDVGDTNWRVTLFPTPDSIHRIDVTEGLLVREGRDSGGAFEADMRNISAAISDFARQFGRIEAIAFAVAGELDKDRTKLVRAGNLTHWVDKPIKAGLVGEFHCRVVLGNDAEAAALADARFGHLARGAELAGTDFVGLIWGSGCGGACVRFVRSWRHRLLALLPVLVLLPSLAAWLKRPEYLTIPSEWGHIHTSIDLDVEPCGCGKRDCVECHCGGNKIPLWYRRRGKLVKSAEVLSDDEWGKHILPFFIDGLEDYLNAQPVKLVIMSGGIACHRSWVLDEI